MILSSLKRMLKIIQSVVMVFLIHVHDSILLFLLFYFLCCMHKELKVPGIRVSILLIDTAAMKCELEPL